MFVEGLNSNPPTASIVSQEILTYSSLKPDKIKLCLGKELSLLL